MNENVLLELQPDGHRLMPTSAVSTSVLSSHRYQQFTLRKTEKPMALNPVSNQSPSVSGVAKTVTIYIQKSMSRPVFKPTTSLLGFRRGGNVALHSSSVAPHSQSLQLSRKTQCGTSLQFYRADSQSLQLSRKTQCGTPLQVCSASFAVHTAVTEDAMWHTTPGL
jgi:hypothetical protein